MPKVTFVNEHRVVEVERGRLVSDVARELGIAFCRESFAGTGIGDTTVWIKGAPDCVSPPGFIERWKGARGQRRFADRARVLGDCEITTQPGLGDRLGGSREIAAPPSPMADPSLIRPPDAAATAAFPYGHPSAVGTGERPAIPRGRGAEVKAKAEKPAKPAATEAAPPATASRDRQGADREAPTVEAEANPDATASRDRQGADHAAPAAAEPAAEAKPPMDPDKAARIAEKKARQAALKARLAAGDPKPGGSEGG